MLPCFTAPAAARPARPLLLVLALCAARAHALTVEELQYILTVFGVVAGSVCFVLCLIDAGWARQKEVSDAFGPSVARIRPVADNPFVLCAQMWKINPTTVEPREYRPQRKQKLQLMDK